MGDWRHIDQHLLTHDERRCLTFARFEAQGIYEQLARLSEMLDRNTVADERLNLYCRFLKLRTASLNQKLTSVARRRLKTRVRGGANRVWADKSTDSVQYTRFNSALYEESSPDIDQVDSINLENERSIVSTQDVLLLLPNQKVANRPNGNEEISERFVSSRTDSDQNRYQKNIFLY